MGGGCVCVGGGGGGGEGGGGHLRETAHNEKQTTCIRYKLNNLHYLPRKPN